MQNRFLYLTFMFLLSAPSLLYADTLSLTTYYPAPFGSYSLLRLNPTTDASMGVCDTSKTGQIYLSSDSNELKICSGTAWGAASPWTLNNALKTVYLTKSDTDTAYKVGIGMAAPDARFHVKGLDDNTHGQLKIESTEDEAKLTLFNADGATATGNGAISMSTVNGIEGMRFLINDDDRMIIDENGNIGIDQPAPNTNLHITGADNANYGQLEIQSTGSDARLSLYNANGASVTGRGDIVMSRTAGSEGLRFLINNSNKMIIDETGNVGIGLTAPAAPLDVARGAGAGSVPVAKFDNINLLDEDGGAYTSNALCSGTNCASTDNNFLGLRLYGDNTNVYNLTLGVPYAGGYTSTVSMNVGNITPLVASRTSVVTDSSVNVGIGVAVPTYKLHVNGPIGGNLDSANPASAGELQVDCQTTPGKCYAIYAP